MAMTNVGLQQGVNVVTRNSFGNLDNCIASRQVDAYEGVRSGAGALIFLFDSDSPKEIKRLNYSMGHDSITGSSAGHIAMAKLWIFRNPLGFERFEKGFIFDPHYTPGGLATPNIAGNPSPALSGNQYQVDSVNIPLFDWFNTEILWERYLIDADTRPCDGDIEINLPSIADNDKLAIVMSPAYLRTVSSSNGFVPELGWNSVSVFAGTQPNTSDNNWATIVTRTLGVYGGAC